MALHDPEDLRILERNPLDKLHWRHPAVLDDLALEGDRYGYIGFESPEQRIAFEDREKRLKHDSIPWTPAEQAAWNQAVAWAAEPVCEPWNPPGTTPEDWEGTR
jgi:hypothetical protein